MQKHRGFTLIELLVVVAIIGILAVIAIPNLLNALHRSRQKRTMADMRSIGTALEGYAADRKVYPQPEALGQAISAAGDLDILAVFHPQNLSPKLQFAIDQFLLRGKPVILGVDPSSQHRRQQGHHVR